MNSLFALIYYIYIYKRVSTKILISTFNTEDKKTWKLAYLRAAFDTIDHGILID